ncbi:MAG: PAS domain-containing protein, partial [Cytophagaceae bacterium]|nr:PAS domain-containing protein [Cytophagaceae bacterium]
KFLAGGGEMSALIRAHDWSKTVLGPPETWPQSLRTLVSTLLNSRFPMFLWWGDDLIQFYNDAYRPSLGNDGKHPTALGQKGVDCWPEIWPTIKPLIDQVRTTREATWSEDQLIPIYRNGRLEDVYWTFSYSAVLDESGQVSGVLVICQETTEKINVFRQIETSEQRLQNLFAQAPVAIATFRGPQFIIEQANPAVCRIWGRTQAQVLNKPLFEALPESAGQGFEELLTQVAQTKVPYVGSEMPSILDRDGQRDTVYWTFLFQPILEDDGSCDSIFVMATDVSEQVLARQKIEESNQRFQQLADSMPQIVWTARPDGYLDYFNQRWYEFTGFDKGYADQSWLPILHPDYVQLCIASWQHSVQTGDPYQIEYRFQDRFHPGEYRWFLGRAVAVRDDAGHIVKWFGSCIDIDDQKTEAGRLEVLVRERTGELVQANVDLQRSNLNLEQFAYVASHDLQEPLRKIQAFGTMLQGKHADRLEASGQDYVNRMKSAADRMSVLINDLLAYSRLTAQPQPFAPLRLEAIVSEVLDLLEMSIRQAEAQVEVGTLPTVTGDRSQLQQLVQNLVSNALKFRRPGVAHVVRINYRLTNAREVYGDEPAHPGTGQYHALSVADNGIGFDPQYRNRIFGMFQRLNGKADYAGSGIGLAICQKIVENHQGLIRAEGQPGQGAIFTVYLPV